MPAAHDVYWEFPSKAYHQAAFAPAGVRVALEDGSCQQRLFNLSESEILRSHLDFGVLCIDVLLLPHLFLDLLDFHGDPRDVESTLAMNGGSR